MDEASYAATLLRIAEALERLSPPPASLPDFSAISCYVWRTAPDRFEPIAQINPVPWSLLTGITRAKETLLANTMRFAQGYSANNALLWGARGMGKSSLVKAVYTQVNAQQCAQGHAPLCLIEIVREDLASLPRLLTLLCKVPQHQFLLFCDDLSFEAQDIDYKSLKAVLDGGLAGRLENVLLYATSNRRHLMSRDMIENEQRASIHHSEAIEEKVSLSDRFGLWLGFHACTQSEYLEMVQRYAEAYHLRFDLAQLQAQAIEWRQSRGAISGRVAWQFIQDFAAQQHQKIVVI